MGNSPKDFTIIKALNTPPHDVREIFAYLNAVIGNISIARVGDWQAVKKGPCFAKKLDFVGLDIENLTANQVQAV